MSLFDKNRFYSKKQDYETPNCIFQKLNDEFHFNLDVCANEENKKCSAFFSEEENGLDKTWNGMCWMNPPYVSMKQWIEKAYNETRKENCTVVMIIPARTNTNWWHEYCMKGEVRFVKGRPKFRGCKHGLPQPLAIVIMKKDSIPVMKSFENWED